MFDCLKISSSPPTPTSAMFFLCVPAFVSIKLDPYNGMTTSRH